MTTILEKLSTGVTLIDEDARDLATLLEETSKALEAYAENMETEAAMLEDQADPDDEEGNNATALDLQMEAEAQRETVAMAAEWASRLRAELLAPPELRRPVGR